MKATDNFKKLFNFVEFTKRFRQVERAVVWKHNNRQENDAEHSYQLALVGWYIAETNKLKLDINKVILYSLLHDLVETYAGDTPLHGTNVEYKNSKEKREHRALIQIRDEFEEFPELVESITQYESKKDPESKFVYALDKLLPVINIYLDDGHSWHVNNINFDMLINAKVGKMENSLEIEGYWNVLKKILEKEKSKLFPD